MMVMAWCCQATSHNLRQQAITWICAPLVIWYILSLSLHELTDWGRDKMAAIFQTTFSNAFSWMKMFWVSNTIWLEFFMKGPFNNNTALVQIMAWRRTGIDILRTKKSTPVPTAQIRYVKIKKDFFKDLWWNNSGIITMCHVGNMTTWAGNQFLTDMFEP